MFHHLGTGLFYSKIDNVPLVSGCEEDFIDLLQQTPSSILSRAAHQQRNEWMNRATTHTYLRTVDLGRLLM